MLLLCTASATLGQPEPVEPSVRLARDAAYTGVRFSLKARQGMETKLMIYTALVRAVAAMLPC